jgi:hypothetical protein
MPEQINLKSLCSQKDKKRELRKFAKSKKLSSDDETS